ncbi:nitrogen fixation protein NifQ [Desulfuromonas sp. CSMB_57]|uniref:nitrogen fixation protein NifQ n=1 Tax=Desulfuromonas sp. CSMB_57 TaxID=2807629 RepID=UPI001CD664C6|nr:nitrogen fixation protein NifQ [Desulfuromonas sp. CSMB_57]
MQGYTETMRRWATDYRRVGVLPDADGTGEVGLGAEEAGRKIAVRFTIAVREQHITAIRYQVFGCGYSMATCAAVAELATGTEIDRAQRIEAAQVDALLAGLPPDRGYCADLAVAALHAAIASADSRTGTVRSLYAPSPAEHGPKVNDQDPIFRALMAATGPPGTTEEDRHLFTCLMAVASQEPGPPHEALGLQREELVFLKRHFFPGSDTGIAQGTDTTGTNSSPEPNQEVRGILLSHVPLLPSGEPDPIALLLAKIIAARTAHPGHLWVAMGLFERSQLSAAIRRHLPSLFTANHRKMRWKRFLFKEVCNQNGGFMCKSPNCGECSDYALCFSGDE